MPRRSVLAFLVILGCSPRPSAIPAPTPSSPPVELLIAATTDIHGWMRGWDYYADRPDSSRGLARVATVVDSLRRSAPGRLVLLDAGDLLQGNPFAYVAARVATTGPNPIIAAMNALEYDAVAVGNHEFNYGCRSAGAVAGAFPFLREPYNPMPRAFHGGAREVQASGSNLGATIRARWLDREIFAGSSDRDSVGVRRAVEVPRRRGVASLVHGAPDDRDTHVSSGVRAKRIGPRARGSGID